MGKTAARLSIIVIQIKECHTMSYCKENVFWRYVGKKKLDHLTVKWMIISYVDRNLHSSNTKNILQSKYIFYTKFKSRYRCMKVKQSNMKSHLEKDSEVLKDTFLSVLYKMKCKTLSSRQFLPSSMKYNWFFKAILSLKLL